MNSPIGGRFSYKAILSTLSAYLELDKLASTRGLALMWTPIIHGTTEIAT